MPNSNLHWQQIGQQGLIAHQEETVLQERSRIQILGSQKDLKTQQLPALETQL